MVIKYTNSIEMRTQGIFGIPGFAEGLLVSAGDVVRLGLVADGELRQFAERQRLLVRLTRARTRSRSRRRARCARTPACAVVSCYLHANEKSA